jgi:hypothetical protein
MSDDAQPKLPLTPGPHDEPVLVHDAASQEDADVVQATLQAAGIPAFQLNPGLSAGAGTIGESVSDTWRNPIYVPAEYVEQAREVLDAPSPSDEELIAAEESDPTTLEEAEAGMRYAAPVSSAGHTAADEAASSTAEEAADSNRGE